VIVSVHPKRGFWTEITYADMDAFRAEQRDGGRQPDLVSEILADEELLLAEPAPAATATARHRRHRPNPSLPGHPKLLNHKYGVRA
jgi:hypothetical protein